MNLGGGDRRRISILQGRNRLKGAQNNILRLKGLSLVSLGLSNPTAFAVVKRQKGRMTPKQQSNYIYFPYFCQTFERSFYDFFCFLLKN